MHIASLGLRQTCSRMQSTHPKQRRSVLVGQRGRWVPQSPDESILRKDQFQISGLSRERKTPILAPAQHRGPRERGVCVSMAEYCFPALLCLLLPVRLLAAAGEARGVKRT